MTETDLIRTAKYAAAMGLLDEPEQTEVTDLTEIERAIVAAAIDAYTARGQADRLLAQERVTDAVRAHLAISHPTHAELHTLLAQAAAALEPFAGGASSVGRADLDCRRAAKALANIRAVTGGNK